MNPKSVNTIALILGGVLVGLTAIQDHLLSGAPLTWQEAAKLFGGGLLGYVIKRFGDAAPQQIEQRVEAKLRAIATPPDDPTDF